MAKSEYLETLEKLQNALNQFDMSFGVSNRFFRLALFSEILDTAFLFEQLYESWSKNLPYGEGPDADVDFSYWKEFDSWESLLNSAKQNACLDNYPFDMGNGFTSDMIQGNRRKHYLKSVNSVLRQSKYAHREAVSCFVKAINNDNTHMITMGQIVFNALLSLIMVLCKIDNLLSDPPQNLYDNFYEMQEMRFFDSCADYRIRINSISIEDLSDRRKCNKLNALKDEVCKNLYESSFLDVLKDSVNIYDIRDYKKEHPDTSKTEDEIREILALAELVDSENRPYKEKVGKYIFKHRKSLAFKDISSFFVYLDVMPLIHKDIEKMKENCNNSNNDQSIIDINSSEIEQVNPVVDAIHELKDVVKSSLNTPKQQFNVYAQPGSTANLGCQMQSPEFKVIPLSKEQQPALESNKEGDENV